MAPPSRAILDLFTMGEDDRITVIGETAATTRIGVVLEADEPEKIERYIEKVTTRYPRVTVIARHEATPVDSCVTIEFGPKPS